MLKRRFSAVSRDDVVVCGGGKINSAPAQQALLRELSCTPFLDFPYLPDTVLYESELRRIAFESQC